jgi:hypothetical protein
MSTLDRLHADTNAFVYEYETVCAAHRRATNLFKDTCWEIQLYKYHDNQPNKIFYLAGFIFLFEQKISV